MGQKPKILIITDTAVIHSGMGVACKQIASRLHNTEKYEIATFGWFFQGAQQLGLKWDLPWMQYTTSRNDKPYGHPEGWPNPSKEQLKASPVYKIINGMFNPDVVIGIGDYWMLDFIYKIRSAGRRFKFIHEVPIDGEPIPRQWVDDLKTADVLISMSEYGKRVIQDAEKYCNVTVLPRGIDTGIFTKINAPKNMIRKSFIPTAENRFVVGVFDRFQDRKQIGRAVEAFAKFISDGKHSDCDLYLHMNLEDPFSLSQKKTLIGPNGIIERYNIRERIITNQKISVEQGVPEKELVALYNSCNVKLSATQGEGWGLTTVEAMACGLPCIGTNYTTFPQLLGENGERGLLADVKTYITGMYNIERALVDTDHIAQHLDTLYRSPALRQKLGDNARHYVQQFRWDTVIKKWEEIIDACVTPVPYRLISQKKVLHTELKDICIYGAVRENTGWAITTRGIAKGFHDIGWNVNIVEGGGVSGTFKTSDFYKRLLTKEPSKHLALINHIPSHAMTLADECNAKYRMIYFPFELDHMIHKVTGGLNRLSDIYLCPTTFVENIAKKSGALNTVVIPLASDIDTKAQLIDIDTKKTYKFLMLGSLGDDRKNVRIAIKAYLSAFTGEDDVTLILKSMPGHENSDPTAFIASELLGNRNPAEIKVIHTDSSDVACFYAACDCLLFPSLCEGWGHPVFEALKFGMPIIASNYGGYLDFISRGKNIQLINGRIEKATKSHNFMAHENWFIPNFEELACAMKKAHALKMRKTGVDYVVDYTWEKTAKAIEKVYYEKIDKHPKVKVYYERMIKNLWNSDNEIGFKGYAPIKYEFTNNAEQADLQILDITRISDKYYLRNKNYILLFHCFGEWSEENPDVYRELFKNAMFVYSHIDLASVYHDIPKEKFMRGPWGSQPDIWFKEPGMDNSEFQILCTGEIAKTEGIQECVLACDTMHKHMLHIGPNFNYKNYSYKNLTNLGIKEMREAYNKSKWVSALRRTEGFEKPAIEGLLCGARPICFDTPLYRHWYGDLACYVKEGTTEETYKDILKVMTQEYKPVSAKEMEIAIKRFAWFYVARNFWNKVTKIREGNNESKSTEDINRPTVGRLV